MARIYTNESFPVSGQTLGVLIQRVESPSLSPNTVETVVTCCVEATSGSLSPCGRGPGRGGQGSTKRLVRAEARPRSPLSLPSPARGEGELRIRRLWGYGYFNGIALSPRTSAESESMVQFRSASLRF